MTITAPEPATTAKRARFVLTDNDVVVNSKNGRFRKTLPFTDAPIGLSVAVHPKAETPVLVRVHQADGYISVSVGTARTDVVLYLETDQVDRFINVLSAARAGLPAAD